MATVGDLLHLTTLPYQPHQGHAVYVTAPLRFRSTLGYFGRAQEFVHTMVGLMVGTSKTKW